MYHYELKASVKGAFTIYRDRALGVTTPSHEKPFSMKKPASNLLMLLLVTAIVTVALIRQELPMPALHSRPAGCHQHGSVPVPQPVSYGCCQAGHDFAILQFSLSWRPDSAGPVSHMRLAQIPVRNIFHKALHIAASSVDPPDIAPLRV